MKDTLFGSLLPGTGPTNGWPQLGKHKRGKGVILEQPRPSTKRHGRRYLCLALRSYCSISDRVSNSAWKHECPRRAHNQVTQLGTRSAPMAAKNVSLEPYSTGMCCLRCFRIPFEPRAERVAMLLTLFQHRLTNPIFHTLQFFLFFFFFFF